MTDLHVITTRGTNTVLDGATVQGFKASLRGELLCPTDAGYEDARQIWNGMIDRSPALIARCAGLPMSSLPSMSPGTTACWCLCVGAATVWRALPCATAAS